MRIRLALLVALVAFVPMSIGAQAQSAPPKDVAIGPYPATDEVDEFSVNLQFDMDPLECRSVTAPPLACASDQAADGTSAETLLDLKEQSATVAEPPSTSTAPPNANG